MNASNRRFSGVLLIGWAAALGTQALAVYAGSALALHLPPLFAVPLAIVFGTVILLTFPLAATLIGALSAGLVWHWPIWLTVLTFFPLGVLNFMIGGTAGIARLATVLRRTGHTA